ncbi:MAG: NmrA family NAD(P)-binding protein [Pseudomonadota bacterium]
MTADKTLVVGATGHVGSQVTSALLQRGHSVRALVRKRGTTVHGTSNIENLEYAVGDLRDPHSIRAALEGVKWVVSTANSIIPVGKTMGAGDLNSIGAATLVEEAERAGVRHFVQSSLPEHRLQDSIPEMAGKRKLEQRLAESAMPSTVIRNPVFMDVWLVITGSKQLIGASPHATTRRPFGFMRFWQSLTGNLVAKRGILLAPGGAMKGAAFVATRDVALVLAASVGREELYNRTIEAGGPEWLTWSDVAQILSKKTGRTVRTITLPAWFARIGQQAFSPVMPSAGNVLGLVRYLATDQPRWEAPEIVRQLNLPEQITVRQYIDENWGNS